MSTKQSVAEYINGVEGSGEQRFFSTRKEYFNNKSNSVHKINTSGHLRNDSNLFTSGRRNDDPTGVNNSLSYIGLKQDTSGILKTTAVNNTFSTWGIQSTKNHLPGLNKDRADVSFL